MKIIKIIKIIIIKIIIKIIIVILLHFIGKYKILNIISLFFKQDIVKAINVLNNNVSFIMVDMG